MKIILPVFRSVLNKIQSYSLIRHSISTTFFNLLGLSVGFFIPFFVATWYGIGSHTDAFFLAYSLILFITNIFAIAVESGIVPFIAEHQNKHPETVGQFVGSILVYATLVLVGIAILFILFGKFFLQTVVRFDPAGIRLTYTLTLEILPLLLLTSWSGVLNGTLNANKIFWLPAISPAIRACCILGFTFAFKDAMGVHALAVAYVFGEIARCCTAGIVLVKKRIFTFSGWFGMWAQTYRLFRVLAYQILGMAVVGLNPLIDRTMASWLGIGKVSLIEYGEKLFYIPTTLLSMGFLTVVLSHWSSQYYSGNSVDNPPRRDNPLKMQVNQVVKWVSILAILATFLLFLFAEQVVTFAYARGKFPAENISQVVGLFSIYLLGVTPYLVGNIFARGILVMKDTPSIAKVSAIKTAIHVMLNLILMSWLGIFGIACSSTITNFVTFGLFFYFFRVTIVKRKEPVIVPVPAS